MANALTPPVADLIAVGTELLLGDTINSNVAWLGQQLADAGIHTYYHTTVGDNPARIQYVIDQALNRPAQPANILIFTGGLGPTEDDLTVATLAQHFGQPLVVDTTSEEAIKRFFIARGMQHSPSNLKQALRPADAAAIANPTGTAPSLAWDISHYAGKPAFVLCFPGVPREMKAMWPEGLQRLNHWLDTHQFYRPQLVRTFLHFFGIGESKIGELLSDLMAAENPTVAPYVGRSSVKLRLAAQADSTEVGHALLAPIKANIIQRLAPYYIGEGDEVPVEEQVATLLKAQHCTIAVGESCTGGLVSSRLTDVPGSSAYTSLNAITYSNEQKVAFLGVDADLLAAHGAVSEPVAAAMAEGIRRKAQSDLGLALTGIAGPEGGSDDKPIGLVWIGLATPTGTLTKRVQVNARQSRSDIKFWFSEYALHYVREWLSQQASPHPQVANSLPDAVTATMAESSHCPVCNKIVRFGKIIGTNLIDLPLCH